MRSLLGIAALVTAFIAIALWQGRADSTPFGDIRAMGPVTAPVQQPVEKEDPVEKEPVEKEDPGLEAVRPVFEEYFWKCYDDPTIDPQAVYELAMDELMDSGLSVNEVLARREGCTSGHKVRDGGQ